MIKNITDSVKYIGTDDLNLDLFESQYVVPEGMAYNSYLVVDEKIAIMDTTDDATASAWKENLAEALGGRTPDYLVSLHVEPDHASLIAWALETYPQLKLVASAKAISMLPQFFEGIDLAGRTIAVKEGEELSLGGRSLKFFAAAMIHWPEVMVAFDTKEGVLFSADAFGKFGALSKCGYTSLEDDDWACEARRYYFNICGKYGVQVQNLLKKLSTVDVKAICSLHGPVLVSDLKYYLDLYNTWSSYGVETDGVFIAYASIHGGTAKAAEQLAEILKAKGCPKVVCTDLCRSDLAENIEDAFRYGKMVLAASSYDATLFPPMHDFLWHLQIKGYQKRTVAIIENGSWAPSAGRVMREMLSAMKDITVIDQTLTIKSTPKAADTAALEAIAEALL